MTATEPRVCGLRFAGDDKLSVVNTFFSVPKGCTSRTFNGTWPADRKRIDYIITRQSHRKFVRIVTVRLQLRADSDHNIVCARVRLPSRFARNRKQQAPTGRKSIDRRAITSDANQRERGVQRLGRAGIRPFRPRGGHQNSPFRGYEYMIPYMVGKLAPNS